MGIRVIVDVAVTTGTTESVEQTGAKPKDANSPAFIAKLSPQPLFVHIVHRRHIWHCEEVILTEHLGDPFTSIQRQKWYAVSHLHSFTFWQDWTEN